MKDYFRLVDSGWDKVIRDAVAANCTELRVICPFIKVRAAERLLAEKCPGLIQVITRFHLGEMCDGFNDTEALRLLLKNGAKIRGVKKLHAKLYLFGDEQTIVTSANLTEAALLRNHEFGFESNRSEIIQRCKDYFASLWKHAGNDLDLARLGTWEKRIEGVRVTGSRPVSTSSLPDEGTDAGLDLPAVILTPRVEEASQSFVKFFGESHNRAPLDRPVLQEVDRTGCHWPCTYPKNKRPQQVMDDAVMFMGRLAESPKDIIVYGRAIGLRHVKGRDEASAAEIERREWKKNWPNYIRVHHAEFVAGTLKNGISLTTLMNELKADSFISTQKNARKGSGNTDPRHAYSQQAHVQLTKEAFAWLNYQMEQTFIRHGKLAQADLEQLDWPDAVSRAG